MKRYFLLLSLVCTAFALSAAHAQVYVSGTVISPGTDTISLGYDPYMLGQGGEKLLVTGLKGSQGKFSFTLKIKSSALLDLSYAGKTLKLYAEPKDTMSMEIQAASFPAGIRFSGASADNNTFLQSFSAQFNSSSDRKTEEEVMRSSASADAYEIGLFERRRAQLEYFKSSPLQPKLSRDFKTLMATTIRYAYLGNLVAYPIIIANGSSDVQVKPLPEALENSVSEGFACQEAALVSPVYREFLKYYVIYFTSRLNNFSKFTDYSASMERKLAFARTQLTGGVFTYWLARIIYEECERPGVETLKKMVAELKESDKSGAYASIVTRKCAAALNAKPVKKKEPVQAETPSGLVDSKGKSVSFSDFKGKVVYVDIWASWCGPCRQQFPFSKQLHERFSEKQLKKIVFVYISIDDSEQNWKKGIEDNHLEGVNLWSKGGWNSQIVKEIGINSIPRYLIIDKTGAIVDVNSKRPSESGIFEQLEKLLE